ncbi:hypothetical protein H5410_006808 [Solanum commersonii]|uniref:Uncharacterized protein n=1 Tax=Solanum commersonii TaxID=4109 RepID=A0A9J6AA58_SOLCO|nr:hypothetical protein H5410_006808 [Solanum commersonii]
MKTSEGLKEGIYRKRKSRFLGVGGGGGDGKFLKREKGDGMAAATYGRFREFLTEFVGISCEEEENGHRGRLELYVYCCTL